MKLRRYYVQYNDGIKFIGNDLSIVSIINVLNNSNIKKVMINVSPEELEEQKAKFAPAIITGKVQEGRKRFAKWLQHTWNDIDFSSNNVNSNETEELARTLSEIMNASNSEIVFVSDSNETIKMKIYIKEAVEINSSAEFHSVCSNVLDSVTKYKMISPNLALVNVSELNFGEYNYAVLDYTLEQGPIQNTLDDVLKKFYIDSYKTLESVLNAYSRNIHIASIFKDKIDELSFNVNECWKELINVSSNNINFFLKKIFEKLFATSKPSIKEFSLQKLGNLFYLYDCGDFEWTEEINGEVVNCKFNSSNRKVTSTAAICPNCGNLITGEIWTTPNGQTLCSGCAKRSMRDLESSRMLGYHTRTIFNPMASCGNKPSEKSRYGFELEMILNGRKGSSEFYETWLPKWYETVAPIMYSGGNLAKLERDGSLGSNGEEMISQPLNKEFILGPKMKELLDACKELYHSESCCGLHFHVDKNTLTDAEWGKLMRFFTMNYQSFVDARIFRPTNHYNSLSNLESYCRNYSDDAGLFRAMCANSSHYSSISISSHTGKTVEFRCFDSTVDSDRFQQNIKTIMMLMDNVEKLSASTEMRVSINK